MVKYEIGINYIYKYFIKWVKMRCGRNRMNKRKGKHLIIVCSIFFLFFYIGIYNSEETNAFLNIVVSEEGNITIQISQQKEIVGNVFEEKKDSYHMLDVTLQDVWCDSQKCFFLPGCFDLSNVYLVLYDEAGVTNQVSLDGVILQKNQVYKIGVLEEGMHNIEIDKEALTFNILKGSSLPSVWIETQEGMQYVHEVQGNATAGEIKLISEDGNIEYIGELESLKGRGNSS